MELKVLITNTKTLIGLENVDNTSDLNKPISTAVQSALSSKQNSMTNGILDTNNVIIDGSITDGDFAKFTSSGLEGRSISELKSDLSLSHSDIDLSLYAGSSSITTLGNITSGNWQGSTINETYIDNSIARKTYVDSVAQGLDIKDALKSQLQLI